MNSLDNSNTINNKEKIFKLIILIISIIGLSLHIFAGIKVYGLGIFSYFTVLSNIAVLVYYLIYFGIPLKSSSILKGYILEPILLTGVLNWFILIPASINYYGSLLPLLYPSNILVHGIIPVLVLVDWYLYDLKGVYTKIEPLKWCVFPMLYTVMIYIKEHLFASGYPYPFYDPQIMGNWNNVFVCLLIILSLYIFVGYGLYHVKAVHKQIEK